MLQLARLGALPCRIGLRHVYTVIASRNFHLQPSLRKETISSKGLEAAVQNSVKPMHMPTISASKQRPTSPLLVLKSLLPLLGYKIVYDWNFDAREFDAGAQQAYKALHEAVDRDTVSTVHDLVSSTVFERLEAMAELQRGLPDGSELSVVNIDSVYFLRALFGKRHGKRTFAIDIEFQAQEKHVVKDHDGNLMHDRMTQPFYVTRAWRFEKSLAKRDSPWRVVGIL
eukprot:m.277127 g.277127  ORF g.277127 m.277127 type:complete len:227 (-) comp17705_c0_seq4:7166-7846(-)